MKSLELKTLKALSGGSISETSLVENKEGTLFVLKKGHRAPPGFFQQEAKGLKALRDSGCVNVPQVYEVSTEHILMEYIATEDSSEDFWRELGRQLAELHRTQVPQLGLDTDNFIGLTPQKNTPYQDFRHTEDWLNFFWSYRIQFQLNLLKEKGAPPELSKAFAAAKDPIFRKLSRAEEEPCLLHGDLWSGNILSGLSNRPYVIDPAIYFGHREADLAMTQLFGGFHYVFYECYQKVYPLKPGWPERFKIYQLYHLLNHWNLFGESYSKQVNTILAQV